MKIFLLSNMYPSNRDGLFGVFVKNFKQRMEKQGVLFVGMEVIKGKTPNAFLKAIRYLKYYLFSLFKGIFVKSDFIYVHFLTHNSPIIIFLMLLFRKKIVVNIHGSDITKFHKGTLIKKLNNLAISGCRRVVVPSVYFKKMVEELFPKVDSSHILVYPSGGINLEVFNVSEEKKTVLAHLKLGMTSRIDKNKGWDIFLKAVAQLIEKGYNVSGFIIGQGNCEKEMLTLRDRLGLRKQIQFLGLLPQVEIAKRYAGLDVFVFPTLLNESLGLVGLEAMACKLPIIASSIGAPKHYVKEGYNGYLFEPGSVDNLTFKLELYSRLSIIERKQLSLKANETAKKYEGDLASKILYNELIELC